MSARRGKKHRVFRTPVGQRIGDIALLVLLIPIAASAAAVLIALGVLAVTSRLGVELESIGTVVAAGAVLVMALIFRSRGWPAWTLELEQDAALLGPFPRRRVPYEDITFIAAGTWPGWLGHGEWSIYGGWGHYTSSESYPLRVETRSGQLFILLLTHSDADKALIMLRARAPNAAALDAEGHEHLPASGDPHAIIAARARLAATWTPLVWLSFAGGIVLVAFCAWGVVHAARDGEWGALFGALGIGGVGGWAFGTAWWKALLRMRGHRRRVQQAQAALRATGQLPEP